MENTPKHPDSKFTSPGRGFWQKENIDQNDWDNFMVFEKCPACESSHFYLQKDFNKILGCGIIIVGIIFVPMTYGLSLAVVALMDWLLYNQVPDISIYIGAIFIIISGIYIIYREQKRF